MWRSVLALVFVGVVAAVVLWVGRSDVRGSPSPVAGEAQPLQSEVTPDELAPAPSVPEGSRALIESVETAELQVTSPPPGNPANTPITGELALAGTIVVVD